MASSYPGPVQIGSYFVGQYYQVLQQQPDLVHQFYSDGSSMVHIDGDNTDTASTVQEIHSLATSLNFSAIEIKKINSYSSWNGGVLVMVTGYVKTKEPDHYGYEFLKPKNLNGKRKFVETFFLAPQEKGFFVHNDIFQFIEESVVEQPPVPVLSEKEIDVQLNASSPQLDAPVSDYVLEEEAREYVSSVRIEDDPVDKYSLPAEQQQQDYEDYEEDVVEEEFHEEEPPTSYESTLETVQEPPPPAVEEPVVEPEKKTYASILRALRDQSASSSTRQPPVKKSVPSSASEWNNSTPVVQPSNSTLPYATESRPEPVVEDFSAEEGEFKSVYVRNLPSTITTSELELEFKNFGTIKPDGVFIRNRKDAVGVCFAFVEFENSYGVQNAIKASPIQLGGRQVYIEERRPNPSGAASRGGRSGRGRSRGVYQSEAPTGRYGGGRGSGRGSYQDGYYQRGYQ